MVGLPSVENREKILRTLLSKEKVEDLEFKEIAAMTEGYSGSDLKVFFWLLFLELSDLFFHYLALTCDSYNWKQNLCVTAAYRPVRELIQQERVKRDKVF